MYVREYCTSINMYNTGKWDPTHTTYWGHYTHHILETLHTTYVCTGDTTTYTTYCALHIHTTLYRNRVCAHTTYIRTVGYTAYCEDSMSIHFQHRLN